MKLAAPQLQPRITLRSCVLLIIAIVVIPAMWASSWHASFLTELRKQERVGREYHLASARHLSETKGAAAQLQSRALARRERTELPLGLFAHDGLDTELHVIERRVAEVALLQDRFGGADFRPSVQRLKEAQAALMAERDAFRSGATPGVEELRPALRVALRAEQLLRLHVAAQRDLFRELATAERRGTRSFVFLLSALGLVGGTLILALLLYAESHQRRLRRALVDAESANLTKSEFLANMSHEIRTPMTAILGYADEILEGGNLARIPPERLRAVTAIRSSGKHLLQVLNDILDLSKIEAGGMTLERLPVSPLQIAAEVASILRVQAQEKGLALAVEHVAPVPSEIETDPTRLRQVLINVVGNAIKFTPQGCVRLVTRLAERDAICFEVSDEGIGMTGEQMSRIYEPFMQADGSTTRKFGGTGLGLSICARLVQMMEGRIEVMSEVGRGTLVRVTIPVRTDASTSSDEAPGDSGGACEELEDERSAPSPAEPLRCRVLLAEDGIDNQDLIRRVLERAGAAVEIVADGRAALERALGARDDGTPFDVVLMDMQMPVLDGYDTTRALRRADYTLPIVALTAHAMPEDRERCLRAGCDDFATKPLDRDQLIAIVARCAAEVKRSES